MTNAYLQGQTFDQLMKGILDCSFLKDRKSAECIMRDARSCRNEGRITKDHHDRLKSTFNKSFPRIQRK